MSPDPTHRSPVGAADPTIAALLDLADWRRRIAKLYAEVRAADAAATAAANPAANPADTDADTGDDDAQRRAAWQRFWQQRDRLFREHPQSPLEAAERAAHRAVPRFPYNPAARTVAQALPPVDATPIEVTLAGDGAFSMVPAARLAFDLFGRRLELTLYRIEGYGNGLFLPFGDTSNGRSGERASYGGGRYLIDTLKYADLGSVPGAGRDGSSDGGPMAGMRLDFNYAYHPSCAYSPRWDCPLAPPANRLPLAIEAGEAYRG